MVMMRVSMTMSHIKYLYFILLQKYLTCARITISSVGIYLGKSHFANKLQVQMEISI